MHLTYIFVMDYYLDYINHLLYNNNYNNKNEIQNCYKMLEKIYKNFQSPFCRGRIETKTTKNDEAAYLNSIAIPILLNFEILTKKKKISVTGKLYGY